jgi:aldehyde:ferredoxin oxidoreductase
MGSKKLKALVLKGNQKISSADKNALVQLVKEYNDGISAATAGSIQLWGNLGTPWMNEVSVKSGDAPLKNWGGNVAEDFPAEKVAKITGMALDKFKDKKYGCFGCSVQCGAILKVPQINIEETHRPEYETCASIGFLLLNDDLLSLIEINELCNRGGIDTISVGGTVAFVMECYENGLLAKDDLDGLELNWGNSKAIIELVKKIINRDGIGDILADGSKIASEKLGKGGEYAITAMGQELAMHSPKSYKSLGMSYAFDPTPGKHTTGSLDMMTGGPLGKPDALFVGFGLPRKFKRPSEERNEAFKSVSALWQATSCTGLCEFAYFFQKYPLTELIKSITGWDITMDEIVKIGMRIQTLRQSFNVREGIDMTKNKLPERAVGVDYVADYKAYCKSFGWNPDNGQPLKETLSELDLDFVIKDLY